MKLAFLVSCVLAFGRCAEIVQFGTDAPPTDVAGFLLEAFPEDTRAVSTHYSTVPTDFGSDIGFSPVFQHEKVPAGQWSHGYEGDVYYRTSEDQVTITLPPLCAFVLYTRPNSGGTYMTRVDIGSGVFVEVAIDSPNAQGFAIYDDGNGMPNTVVVEVESSSEGLVVGEFCASDCTRMATTTRMATSTLLPTTTTRMPTTSTLLPTTTMWKPTTTTPNPTTTTLLPTTTRPPTSTELPTSTGLPTSTVLPTTTLQSSASGWESTSASPMSSLAVFECFDQCVIAAQRVDDGYCDCGQCEDESIWSCDACGGCPLSCGLSVQCQRQSTTSLESTSNEKPGSGGKKKSVDVVMVVAVSVGGFFGPILCVLAVYYFWFANTKEEVTEEVIVVMSTSKDTDIVVSLEMGEGIGKGLAVGKPTAGGPVHGEGDDSEELRDALLKVAKAKRDEGDEEFGQMIASMRVGNDILEEDVFDQIDGVQPTRGEGSAQTRGLRLSQALIAAQPEGGGVALNDEQVVIHVTTAGQ